jgi:hypothetical protein
MPGPIKQIPAPNPRRCYGLETDARARVLVRSDGLRHGAPEVLTALAPACPQPAEADM